jgi:tRNA pseudouridine38-40 synthase
MRRQARYLLGRHNFRAFAASDGKKRGYWRTIKRIKIDKRGALLYIEIEADGFLYNMARNIAGTLIDMGRGRVFPGGLKRILLSRERSLAGPTAPAKGLCLVKVKY